MSVPGVRAEGWARRVGPHGCVFYSRAGVTSWIHPGLSQLLLSLDQFDTIRYAAYRLSTKLLTVQQALATSQIPLALARSVLSHHGLSDPSACLDSAELRDLLRELYTRARRAAGQPARHGGEDGEALASLVEQLIDPGHQGGVNVLGLKTVLAVVTGARLRDRLSFLFREHADHQAKLTAASLTHLLSLLCRIPELLGESVMFGSSVIGRGVESCLRAGGGRLVTEEVWMAWAGREPPELVWLTTAYRQSAATQVRHSMRCSACQRSPMEGLRYQCLQCLSYDLCQDCFFVGRATKGHKPQHPVQEYCYPSTRREEARAFFATIANKFRARQAHSKAKKKIKRSLAADRGQTGVPSSKPSRSKLAALLPQVRTSPRTVPRGTKASPASSGFCSGEDAELVSAETSPTTTGDPVYEVLKDVDSPGLEWDEGGIELGDTSAGLGEKEFHCEALANFENSIFRRDEETGNMHCYQHNTRRGRVDAMTSIIGHLEEDHRALQDRLSAAPELVQPVLEAQSQLTRLKDLMANMFASRNFLDQQSPEKASSPLTNPVNRHESTRFGSRDLEARGVERPGIVKHESTRIGGEVPPCTPRHRRFRAAEAEGWDLCSPIVYPEAARLDNQEVEEEEEEELECTKRTSNPEYLTLVRVENETDEAVDQEDNPKRGEANLSQPGVTFTCLSSSEKEPESSDPFESSEDLSRLGGTGLYISRDNGLDITDKLGENGDERRDSRYDDTVDELEKLMVRLSDAFDSFRNPKPRKKSLLEEGDEGIFGLVTDINNDFCAMLASSKESQI